MERLRERLDAALVRCGPMTEIIAGDQKELREPAFSIAILQTNSRCARVGREAALELWDSVREREDEGGGEGDALPWGSEDGEADGEGVEGLEEWAGEL
jgi:hypothetical protein